MKSSLVVQAFWHIVHVLNGSERKSSISGIVVD